ncbi:MAG: glycosyl transferase [Flavobacterium sp. BFFFF1]|uniref:glycosyltransferase family 2 protein n=1 Tax=Flavobacterium sp. BFFFF1 TaxID=2015557 RepID=UPI000BC37C49|nr:glycosyltransferase family A protein [Flavobacterium sp. BFFFF1]OYU79143.1 MAG: glycosyl transferase [Flavobacterium sp. BFFFF1]
MEHALNNIAVTTSAKPLVAIIICTFNRETYLAAAVDSIIGQTNGDWEIIVVDDGSDDDTFTLINNYVMAHANIRYVKQQNRKLALTRNVGLINATGKYVTFLDSDDTLQPTHLQSRIDYLTAHPDIDLVQGGLYMDEEIFVPDFYKQGQMINLADCVAGSTFFGKRKVFLELGGFNNLAYGEDTEFWSRAEGKYNTAHVNHLKTYNYTRAEDSITKSEQSIRNLNKGADDQSSIAPK